MKILITGSSGYVGYILSKFFSEQEIEVIGLDITKNKAWGGNNKFTFYHCDITNKEKINQILSKELPSHVIHLAYLMDPIHDVKKEYSIDVIGSRNILEIANNTESVKQFIQFSSASAYGGWPNNPLWIKETHELRPRDYRYGINKKIVEKEYLNFDKRKNLNLIILRMCTAMGPLYHKKGGVIAILTNSPLLLKLNNRYCELQFIHEDDLTNLLNLMVNDNQIEGVYNLAPDSYATIKQLAPKKTFIPVPLLLLRGIIGLLWWLRIVTIRPAAMTLSTYGIIIDPKKIVDRYGYKFKYTTLDGFKETVKKRKELGTL
jgi:UDP-glucose 4-epimerase